MAPMRVRKIEGLTWAFLILLLACGLRLVFLELRPPHLDEGVNGWFIDKTMPELGYYPYNPAKYHGPLFFYILFFFKQIFGHHLWALRLASSLFGIGTVLIALRFKEFIQRPASLLFGLFLALSPGLVFYSRDAIHESAFLFFTFLFFWGALKIGAAKRRGAWLLAAGLAGMILLKETWIFNVALFLIGAWIYRPWRKDENRARGGDGHQASKFDLKFISPVIFSFIFVVAFFYSGFFQNPTGVIDIFRSFKPWSRQAVEYARLFKPFYFWLELILLNEPAALLGLLLALPLLTRRQTPALTKFIALYGLGELVVYSVIPYKTPWCALNIIWPFQLLAALFCTRSPLLDAQPLQMKHLKMLPVCAGLIVILSAAKTYSLNFLNYDHAGELYVLNQTTRQTMALCDTLAQAAKENPALKHERIRIFLSKWPLPWVLEEFSDVQSDPEMKDKNLDGLFLVAKNSDRERLESRVKHSYYVLKFDFNTFNTASYAYFDAAVFRPNFANDPRARLFVPVLR